ncbi:MAG: hypothetical protein KIS81_11540 [Maricaulaceae bacterium]|nr:hypothetical protein [Maricaulaceae bacterium]
MQTDSIGQAGGLNLYAYVGNDPINFTDPWGLSRASRGRCDPTTGRNTVTGVRCSIVYGARNVVIYSNVFSGGGGGKGGGNQSGDWRDEAPSCEHDQIRLSRYLDPLAVPNAIDSAISQTTLLDLVQGKAGNNVSGHERYTYTQVGWVDHRHVVSSAHNPLSNVPLSGYFLGLGLETKQLFSSNPNHRESAFQPEGLRSNLIGSMAYARHATEEISIGQATFNIIDEIGAIGRAEVVDTLRRAPTCVTGNR